MKINKSSLIYLHTLWDIVWDNLCGRFETLYGLLTELTTKLLIELTTGLFAELLIELSTELTSFVTPECFVCTGSCGSFASLQWSICSDRFTVLRFQSKSIQHFDLDSSCWFHVIYSRMRKVVSFKVSVPHACQSFWLVLFGCFQTHSSRSLSHSKTH